MYVRKPIVIQECQECGHGHRIERMSKRHLTNNEMVIAEWYYICEKTGVPVVVFRIDE